MKIRYKFWIEDQAGVLFGDGRYTLLAKVASLGSLSAAAKDMSMSYRAAWGRIKAAEKRLGCKLLEPAPVGRGMVLTKVGWDLLNRYKEFQEKARLAVLETGQKIFNGQGELGLQLDDVINSRPDQDITEDGDSAD